MSGLFGGHKDTPAPQPVTLPAPAAATPQEVKGQTGAADEALKRAQAASTIAGAASSDSSTDSSYSSTKLGG